MRQQHDPCQPSRVQLSIMRSECISISVEGSPEEMCRGARAAPPSDDTSPASTNHDEADRVLPPYQIMSLLRRRNK